MKGKKLLCLLLAALMVMSLCACGSTAATTTTTATAAPAGTSATAAAAATDAAAAADTTHDTQYISFGTGTTGGVFYTAGIGIGTLLTDKTWLNVTVEATKASAENVNLLNAGDIEIATASFPTTLQAYSGEGSWANDPQNIAVLFQMYENPIHVIVMADSDIHTMADLKGKTISVGQAGSGNYNSAVALLEGVYGMKDGVDYKAEYLSYTESEEAFKNGTIDCAVFDTVSPHSTIIDLASWKPIRLIPIQASDLENLDNEYAKQFVTFTIPGGTYTGQDEDTLCAAHGNYVICRGDMDDDTAYTIVKTVMENLDYLATVHDALGRITLDNACLTGGLPLHPGAQKYFEEQGVKF